ncbi:hypothetical protein JVT61DRAFT_9410 [Boletus reticuloceps]|uniref:Choline/carnitine acyltransferase domain-containing protein n=1 Tax=Boletus reticuloceps TaxID=495285 RepID=A0A8I2YGH3_9AGAM|nr:hypothetical protein JVT61DRAFT_9410 [Boletus reticuloceps]
MNEAARHIVDLGRGQFSSYWRNVLRNPQAIVQDAEKFLSWRFVNGTHTIILPPLILNGVQVSRTSVGVLTTKIQKTWSRLRQALAEDRTNAACLRLIDDRLFIVCLDDAASAHEGIENMRNDSEMRTEKTWWRSVLTSCVEGTIFEKGFK